MIVNPNIVLASADLLSFIDEMDQFLKPNMKHGLDQVILWCAATEDVPTSYTFTYRPTHMSNTHRETTWFVVPSNDDEPIMQTRDHATMLKMVTPSQGVSSVYVSWLMPSHWCRIQKEIKYSLNIERQRVTGRMFNAATS